MSKSVEAVNGFVVRNWKDVLTIATLLAMLLAVVMWGLKLESELNTERTRINDMVRHHGEIDATIRAGILPRADERLKSLDERVKRLEDDVD